MNTTNERPNFLFIMTDQQRGDCLSIDGHPVLQTPNMDSIGGAGVRFRKAYVTCPSCIAARRSILTGQFPSTHGMVGYRDGVEWDAPTLPDELRRNGYETAMVGRSMHQFPVRKRYGYETMVQHDHKIHSDYDRWLKRYLPDTGSWFSGGVMHNDWTARPWPHDEALHISNWTTTEALKFLERRDPSCPYFLTVSYLGPHPPLQPPAFYMDRYLRQEVNEPYYGDWCEPPADGGIGDDVAPSAVHLTGERLHSARAGYYGLINHIDDQIRLLLNSITGVDRNTVIIFTSDHGEMLGDHYHWRKQVPFEGSARIPMLCRAPERFGIQQRSVIDDPVCLEDIMPTVLDMAGLPIPETVDGHSLYPLMRGERPDWRHHLHIEHSPIHQTLTDGREKFIWYVADGRELFFDLRDDPNELSNRIDDPRVAGRVEEWRRLLIEELADRPEGFTDGEKLIAGRRYGPTLPHAGGSV